MTQYTLKKNKIKQALDTLDSLALRPRDVISVSLLNSDSFLLVAFPASSFLVLWYVYLIVLLFRPARINYMESSPLQGKKTLQK